jgi:hypothetical protein
LLFRATSLDQIVQFTRILVTGPFEATLNMQLPTTSAILAVPVLIALEVAQFTTRSVEYHRRLAPALRGALYALLTVLFLLGTSNEAQQFIYFQF